MKKKIVMFIFLALWLQHLPAIGELADSGQVAVQSISLADAPLSQVLDMLEELTGKPILRDSELPAVSIDLHIRTAMTRGEAILAVESALALNRIAIVELGDGLLKAVSAKQAPMQAPSFVEGSLLGELPSEKICSKLFSLQFLNVGEFSKLIAKLLNPELSSAIVFEESNSILITDSVSTLQRVELLIGKVDVPKHSSTESKIFRIKHGDAKEIAELLNNVVKGQQSKSANPGGGAPAATALPANATSLQFSKNLSIDHETRSNAVVVCGTPKDIEHVSSIIDQIDVLLDQVRIEVVIAQVMLKKGQASGLESLGLGYNVGGDGGNDGGQEPGFTAGGNDISLALTGATPPGATGSTFTINGNLRKFAMNTVFKKAKTDSNVQVLSAPTIVTTHNREALIKIVDSRPIVTSQLSDSANPGATKSSVEYKDIGIELKVKPLIGVNGIIQLEINQRVETLGPTIEINGNETPTTVKRDAISFVSVYDGDTIVMAGLQEKKTTRTGGKIWLFGDLPIVGKLFSPKSRQEETTELIIFIKPTIVTNPVNEEAYAKKMLKGASMSSIRNEIEWHDATGKFLPIAEFPKKTLSDPDSVDNSSDDGSVSDSAVKSRDGKRKARCRFHR
ncbi:MAG: hypothetical protein LBI61_01495 [Puniceicoccales bacterium]|jgi:type II secretory pathway component GspD/PulD (secretin)|nr:hypothetical protein [Puniceicoccales bacterium]